MADHAGTQRDNDLTAKHEGVGKYCQHPVSSCDLHDVATGQRTHDASDDPYNDVSLGAITGCEVAYRE